MCAYVHNSLSSSCALSHSGARTQICGPATPDAPASPTSLSQLYQLAPKTSRFQQLKSPCLQRATMPSNSAPLQTTPCQNSLPAATSLPHALPKSRCGYQLSRESGPVPCSHRSPCYRRLLNSSISMSNVRRLTSTPVSLCAPHRRIIAWQVTSVTRAFHTAADHGSEDTVAAMPVVGAHTYAAALVLLPVLSGVCFMTRSGEVRARRRTTAASLTRVPHSDREVSHCGAGRQA